MNFPSIRIEGAILSPDIIDRVDELPGQRPADFGLATGDKVKDEIARAWADAQDYWRIFRRKLENLKPDNPATSETRNNWIVPLLGLLKYDLEFQRAGREVNGKNYAISHRVINRANTPIHIVGYQDPAGLDRKPANATLRMSAHALVQQYINLSEELYGIVTNGRVIRLLRDSSRLIKQSYLEFDLDRIFTDGLFADFAVLYRLLHSTRLPHSNDSAPESLLERYHQDSLDSGARIREGLSKAVEGAILLFGTGFLSNPANIQLREDATTGRLDAKDYYKSLLRLIYRLLFLMVIEERDLVFPENTPKQKRDIYAEYYSVQRLRNLSEKRYLADKRHDDLWQALLSTFHLFEADGLGEKVGIKPLAGDLFSPSAIAEIFNCRLGNDVLLPALRSLGIYEHPDTRQLIRVNYAALNVEEFGSVYEGLLEYEPVFDIRGSSATFGFRQGDERARTGSHYTPDELVQPLIKHSLDYLIEDRLKTDNPETSLLDLRVADIACGSGHILLAAARRIALELAIVRTSEEQPSPTAYRKALRDVIRNCIYGVDVNPLAVELCKVALWLEAHNPGEPLNFLDHHIKCGNAIVGFVSREDIDNGVPDEAFVKMPGDDPDFGKAIRAKNKVERIERSQQSLKFTEERRGEIEKVLERWREITALPERTPSEIDAKKHTFEEFSTSGAAWTLEQLASMPIAQFFIPKTPENLTKLITDAEFREYWSGERRPQGQGPAMSDAVAAQKKFFHWFLEFPGIMERGGFDCILGNPPYLGGTYLSGTFGHSFCECVIWEFRPAAHTDLVAYFLRRINSLLRHGGFAAVITTNSIRDGDIRETGLQVICNTGGQIVMADINKKWPGQAKVNVSLVAFTNKQNRKTVFLNGRSVDFISPYLDEDSDDGPPISIKANSKLIAVGSEWGGKYFLIDSNVARQLLLRDKSYAAVVLPVINGDELNNDPNYVDPARFALYFAEMSESEASKFEGPFELLRDRSSDVSLSNAVTRKSWWKFRRSTVELYEALTELNRCFVVSRTTKYMSFISIDQQFVLSKAVAVVLSDRWDFFAIIQSNFHEVWARKYSGALKQDLRYSPSDCFGTFAFPEFIWDKYNPELADIGERYHTHRNQLMLMLWLGLTKIYNLFHDPRLSVDLVANESGKDETVAHEGYEGLLELRRLHVEMDNAVRDAYGWHELNLGHDFYEVETLPENDRTRFTINPNIRKEVLRRLLALNHERALEEGNQKLNKKENKVKQKGRSIFSAEPEPTLWQESE